MRKLRKLCSLLLCLLATFALGSVASPSASTSATFNAASISPSSVAPVAPPVVVHIPGLPTPTCGGITRSSTPVELTAGLFPRLSRLDDVSFIHEENFACTQRPLPNGCRELCCGGVCVLSCG
jgi:hypothetical protein